MAEAIRLISVSDVTYCRWRQELCWRRKGLRVPAKQPERGRLWLNDGSCIGLRAAPTNPTSFSGHAPAGAKADPKLTFVPDRPGGSVGVAEIG